MPKNKLLFGIPRQAFLAGRALTVRGEMKCPGLIKGNRNSQNIEVIYAAENHFIIRRTSAIHFGQVCNMPLITFQCYPKSVLNYS